MNSSTIQFLKSAGKEDLIPKMLNLSNDLLDQDVIGVLQTSSDLCKVVSQHAPGADAALSLHNDLLILANNAFFVG